MYGPLSLQEMFENLHWMPQIVNSKNPTDPSIFSNMYVCVYVYIHS